MIANYKQDGDPTTHKEALHQNHGMMDVIRKYAVKYLGVTLIASLTDDGH